MAFLQKPKGLYCNSMIREYYKLHRIFPITDTSNIIWTSGSYGFKQQWFFFFSFIFISWRLITLQYCSGFYHTLTWISHGVTCIPHPDPPSHLPLHPIPLGLLGAPGPSTCLMHPTWAGDPNNSDSCTIAWICCRTFSCSEPHLKMADFSVTQYMGCTTIQRCKHFSRYP